MSDWTAGYVADIGYTYGYYSELNPQRIRLAFLHQGLHFPEVGAACELGFGQGLSTNIHAAGSLIEWHGTDFNPSQAAFAQELVAASGVTAHLHDDAFADFAKRPDLPDFDFIALHGIWSWISDENRHVIVDFIRKKLKVGGVLYISYNTQPGWAAFAPMRHLMTEHAEVLGSEGRGIVSRIDGALEFAEKLIATNPLFSRANPLVGDRLKKMKEHNRHYLAHEYFNKDWHPMHFATMADWLESAKLQFACSAHYIDHIDSVNLTAAQQTFLAEVPDLMFRETVRDFMVNQQFRRDYWIKGARKMDAVQQTQALRSQRVLLTAHRPDISLKIAGTLGEADMNVAIYAPILDLLADHKVRTIEQLEKELEGTGIAYGQLLQAMLLLAGAGHLSLVQDEAVINKARKQTDRLNAHLTRKACGNNDVSYLASPVTGGGYSINRIQQLFLLARQQGQKTPESWARFTWDILRSQKQRIIKEGKTIESDDGNLQELTSQASAFATKQIPILTALEII